MPLPPLRPDGMLPPGIHAAILDEVIAAFSASTPQRQMLNDALRQCVATVKRLHLADQIALDGSYLSGKPDPQDVDIVVLTPGVYQLAGEQQFAAEGIDAVLLDIQFAHDAAAFQGWLTFFSTARNHTLKGFVSLVYWEANMKTTQPPITNDEELAGYRAGTEQLLRMIERHEGDLMAERQKSSPDAHQLDQIRYQLHHLYGYYKGIQDAIEAYLRQRRTA